MGWKNRLPWWCWFCKKRLSSMDVTYEESHDERAGGCGFMVVHANEAAMIAEDKKAAEGKA